MLRPTMLALAAAAAFLPGSPVLYHSEAVAQQTPPPQTPVPPRPTRDCEHEGPVTS